MRNRLPRAQPKADSHVAMLLQRYVAHPADGSEQWSAAKRTILKMAICAADNVETRGLYSRAFDRWTSSLPTGSMTLELRTLGRLIVGLGSENVLETGLRLHHTYGLPVVPGSAIKGLCAHYCDQVWGSSNSKFKKPVAEQDKVYREFLDGKGPSPPENYHRLLFGNTDDSGCMIFHDAWLTPNSSSPLCLDVMTPHHPGWMDGLVAPSDFDSPNPVPFLSVAGQFLFAISWCGPPIERSTNWTKLVCSLLLGALAEWGIGGKTSSGYGRFDVEQWRREQQRRESEQAAAQAASERVAELAKMSPMERSMEEVIQNHPNQQDSVHIRLLEELKKENGRWQSDDDRRAVANRIKQEMTDAKKWGKKGKDAERTAYVKKILGE
jgi:CRISPR-associated protein Cmr6